MIHALIRFVTVCGLALAIVASVFGVGLALVDMMARRFIGWTLTFGLLVNLILLYVAKEF